MSASEKYSPRENTKIQTYDDPYLLDLKPDEMAVCKECKSVYVRKRWELASQAGNDLAQASHVVETLCPACRKIRDRQPGGIITLSGQYAKDHKEEIVNLIHNENDAAMQTNPLERIMDIEETDGGMVVMTTNEKLAQRIGRAVNRAMGGDVEYKWSKGTKLARVNWHRD